MSSQANTYVIWGCRFGYSELKSRYDDLEPYMDSPREGIQHKDGLCVLYDGMNGEYVIIGHVLAKSGNHEGLDSPIILSEARYDGFLVGLDLKGLLKEKLGLVPPINQPAYIVLTHYR